MIEVQNLSHVFRAGEEDEIPALVDVNMEIFAGEFVAIVGHNGSGKSTLAKHFNSLLQPTSGDVLVNGINTKNEEYLWEIRQQVGMVFQNPDNQLVATVVDEDVAFGPENLGVEPAEIRQRVDEALGIVGMEEFKARAPHLLSGGQKQRVAIAGIIAMRPRCIVLDEATAMLDPVGRREVLETIKRLNRQEQITVVLITHFMEETIDCDRVIVLEEGGLAMEGSPAEVFTRVEKVRASGLDVPQMTELAWELIRAGMDLPPDILRVEEMVNYLCP